MTDNWVMKSIEPKSDQLNADDLITGPITVTITDVKRGSDEKQPIVLAIDGDRQPYKPCKSMRRLLIKIWGDEPKKWIGHKLLLFCDTDVMYGGVKVGGIRIKGMSGIKATQSVMLTVSRGKKAEVRVEPIIENEKPDVATRATKAVQALSKCSDRETLDKYQSAIEEFFDICDDTQKGMIRDAVKGAEDRVRG